MEFESSLVLKLDIMGLLRWSGRDKAPAISIPSIQTTGPLPGKMTSSKVSFFKVYLCSTLSSIALSSPSLSLSSLRRIVRENGVSWNDPEIPPVRGRGKGRAATVSQSVQVPRGGKRGRGAKKPRGRGRADPVQSIRTALSRSCKRNI